MGDLKLRELKSVTIERVCTAQGFGLGLRLCDGWILMMPGHAGDAAFAMTRKLSVAEVDELIRGLTSSNSLILERHAGS